MTISLDYVPLLGGLDESSGRGAPQPGRLLACENFEVAYGEPGYRRIAGYERFDGRTAPSSAAYVTLPFNTGVASIAVGNTVTTGTGSGYVLRVQINSGSWGANAAGVLILTNVTGTFSNAQAIQVSAVTKATATGPAVNSSTGDATYKSDTSLAREYYRGLIAKPTGDGAILGLKIYNGDVYCVRNVVGSATATLWKSSSSGWTAIRTGLRPGGTVRMITASFSGAAGSLALFGADGKNRYWRWNGTTFTFGPSVWGTEATSSTSLTIGTGAKVFTVSDPTGKSWTAGQSVIAYSASNAANSMTGTVTTWSSPTLTLNITSTTGSGTLTDWHICMTDGTDRPTLVAAHKNYLWLAFPRGQLQSSNVGDPLTFSTTASLLGTSDEIIDLKTLRGDTLAAMCQNKVVLVYGSGSTADPWLPKQHSETTGTYRASTQEMGGNAVYISSSGVMSLAGTQSFGDFDASTLSMAAQRTLRKLMLGYTATSLVRKDSQYRVYGADKQVLVMTFMSPQMAPDSVVFTRLRYLHQAVCTDTALINNEEYVVFGTSDGWVMRERIGTTFDGTAISGYMRTSYWHHKSAQVKKRFRRIVLEVDSAEPTTLYFKQDFDFSNTDYVTGVTYDDTVYPPGGVYGVDNWGEFYWGVPEASQVEANVDGVGRYMSVTISTTTDVDTYRIYGMQVQFSPIGAAR